MDARKCSVCGSGDVRPFYRSRGVPANSCQLVRDVEASVSYPKAEIDLVFCNACSAITNQRFDDALVRYTESYESSQHFSPKFREFANRLTARLVEDFSLQGKTVLEVGCDKADFLRLICEATGGRGIGVDPAADSALIPPPLANRIRLDQTSFDPEAPEQECDFICCRHTLEHIWKPAKFMADLRKLARLNGDVPIFVEVPDATRVLEERAFWDIYHEHCNYFTPASLVALFELCGLRVTDLWRDFDDQYLCIVGVPAAKVPHFCHGFEPAERLEAMVEEFRGSAVVAIEAWRTLAAQWKRAGHRVAIWAASSKSVAFLAALGGSFEVAHIVDVNPRKQGTYLPGTRHKVISPSELKRNPPTRVILMNPIYENEVRDELGSLGIQAEVFGLDRQF